MRKKLKKLNKNWQIKKDQKNKGIKESWYKREFIESEEVEVSIPWQCYGKEFIDYTGYLWYQKSFNISKSLINNKEEAIIEFEAVDYRTDVWLNGIYLGKHEGGYIPFEFKVKEYLNFNQENLLTLRVYDPRHNEEIPHGKQGSWYTRVSGIWQDVNLKKISKNHIKNVFLTSDIDNNQLLIDLEMENPVKVKDSSLYFKIYSPKNDEIITKKLEYDCGKKNTYKINIKDPFLWSPNNPNLYNIEIKLIEDNNLIDIYTDYFGMRKVELKNGKIYLNNEELFIRGALDQGFWPQKIYKAKNREAMIDELKKTKEMGFNLLRKHIKTPLPEYLELADKMGVLIWQEAPNYSKWNKQARERFKKEYTDMVLRDYNHPSIIIWSLYNEEWGLEWDLKNDLKKQEWVTDFYDYAKNLDKTRVLCDNSGWAHVKTDINDYHRYFATPENNEEWSQDLDSLLSLPENNFVKGYESNSNNKAIIMSEFGMWGLPTYSKLISQFKELPEWFNGSAVIFDEDFKIPKTLEINFDKYNLDSIFKDYDELSLASQKREFVGVKYQIEEMRKRKDKGLGGYVVTELTDIEWETNGFLDYFRNYKYDPELIKEFNGPLILSLDLEKRKLWSNQQLIFTPHIINDLNQKFEGEIIITFDNEIYRQEIVKVKENSVKKLDEMEINLSKSQINKSKTLKAQLVQAGEIIAENKEKVLVVSKNIICEKAKDFIKNNKNSGFLISDHLDQKLLKKVWEGESLLFLAEKGDQIQNKSLFNFNELEKGESWDKASSYHFINNEKLGNNFLDKISTWELENLFPDYTIINIEDLYPLEILSGYFSGWIGKVGATTMAIEYGTGKIIATTLKLKQYYADDPIATIIFNDLLNMIKRG